MKKIRQLADQIFETETSAVLFAFSFLSIIFLRVFVEQFVAKSAPIGNYENVIEFIHNMYFFLTAFVLIWLYLSLILKINPSKLSYLFSWASFLIIFPPLIDMIKTKGEVFWSFYILGSPRELLVQFFTFFGHLPSGIVYFGTKITFILAIILIGALVFLKTQKFLKSLLAATVTYVILFLMGSFPSFFAYFYYFIFEKKSISQIQDFNVAQLFGSPDGILGIQSLGIKYSFAYRLDILYFPFFILALFTLFYIMNREKFWAIMKNFRYPQIIYHSGLLFIGAALGFLQFGDKIKVDIFSFFAVFSLLISVWLAWKASVVVNDVYDLEIDRISNPNRPLPKEIFTLRDYSQFGLICFILSLLGAVSLGFKFLALILVYQIIAWFYSAPPFRLKKFPIVATFISSLASLMVLFMGYILVAQNQSIENLSWRIILLMLISYTLSIPIKDLKDIEGDKKYGIWTIPVILGEEKGKLAIAIGIFISFMLSVFFLNELRLFWWAVLFGIITFFMVVSKKIRPERIFWWVLGSVSIYLLVLVKIVFLDNLDKLKF